MGAVRQVGSQPPARSKWRDAGSWKAPTERSPAPCSESSSIPPFLRPSQEGRGGGEPLLPRPQHSAVRLIRSSSVYVVGGPRASSSESLKIRSAAAWTPACTTCSRRDRAWMLSRTQDCLQYLQELLALSRSLSSLNDLAAQLRPRRLSTSSKSSRRKEVHRQRNEGKCHRGLP